MSLILSGTDGLSDVDGSAATPAIRGTDANTGIFFPAADTIAFAEGGAEVARFNSSGYFGIGTTSPSQLLHVNSAGAAIGIFQSTLAAGNTNVETRYISTNRTWGVGQNIIQTSSIFEIADITASATRLAIDSSGNLGIGTSSPTYKLDVSGNIRGLINNASVGNESSMRLTQNGSGDAAISFLIGATTEWLAGVDNSDSDSFKINAITGGSDFTGTGITLTTSGNLLVGTTSVVLSGKLTTSFTGNTINGATFDDTGNGNGAGFIIFSESGTAIGSVSRVASTSAVAFNTTSDYRLKTVTGSVTGQGERIDALKPIDYQWKDGGQNARGFLAHEFQTVYPNSVTGDKDAVDADGNPKHQSMQAATSEVIADLVAEIQSLRKRLAALESA